MGKNERQAYSMMTRASGPVRTFFVAQDLPGTPQQAPSRNLKKPPRQGLNDRPGYPDVFHQLLNVFRWLSGEPGNDECHCEVQ